MSKANKDTETNAKQKKGTKRKRATVAMPKMTNKMKPRNMSLVDWQIALRRQQAEKENFAISQIDEKFCPGEYRVGNFATRNTYKVVYRGMDSVWNIAHASTSRPLSWERANILRPSNCG